MRFARTARRPEPGIDLTPMLDVTFNLLLFFAVSTNFIDRANEARTPGIDVDLPRAGAETVLSDAGDLSVWIASDGAVYVDERPVSLAELEEAFRSRAASRPNTLVILKADEGVSHGRVVAVMDRARTFGLTRLAIATTLEDQER